MSNAGLHEPNPTSRAFLDACVELGFPSTDDFNGPNMEGAGWHHINVKDGKRVLDEGGLPRPGRYRENLTLSQHSQATRLILEDGRCVGVEYVKDGERHEARATREVIVCAGAIESPHLLHGLGHRRDAEPAAVRDRDPGRAAGRRRELPQPRAHRRDPRGQAAGADRQAEPLGGRALLQVRPGAGPRPTCRSAFVHVPFDIIVGQSHPNAISILPGVVRPLSRGYVRLSSADPLVKPRVNPNYLAAKSDRDRLVQGVKLAREIFATRAFSDWAGEELLPGPDVGNSDDDLDAFVTRQRRLVPPPGRLVPHGPRRARRRRSRAARPRRRGPAGRRRERDAGRPVGQLPRRDRDDRRALRRLRQDHARPASRGRRHGRGRMSLEGKKVAVLMEADYYEPEIWYYQRRFPEEGAEVHFLTRLWGQERLTFAGHEWKVPFEVDRSFEDMDDATLRSYDAVIVPSGMVSDRLRYTEDVAKLPPATEFIQRAFAEPSILKGIICHGMWLVAPVPELVRGRPVVVHNNLHGDAVNMGAIYTDEDVVVDGDLVTARTGGHCHLFAHKIIELLGNGGPR